MSTDVEMTTISSPPTTSAPALPTVAVAEDPNAPSLGPPEPPATAPTGKGKMDPKKTKLIIFFALFAVLLVLLGLVIWLSLSYEEPAIPLELPSCEGELEHENE